MATQEWESQDQERGLDSGFCLMTLTLARVRALIHNPSTQKDTGRTQGRKRTQV